MSSETNAVDLIPATAAEPSTIRVKPSRKTPDTSSKWKCLHCNKHFSDKYCLVRHSKKCIGNVENPPVSDNRPIVRYSQNIITSLHSINQVNSTVRTPEVTNVRIRRHSCSICQKSYAHKSDFVYHTKSYHPEVHVDTICRRSRPMRHTKLSSCPGEMTLAMMNQLYKLHDRFHFY